MSTSHYLNLVRETVAGRPWICADPVLVASAARCEQLLELGAARVLAIGASRGAGDLPDPDRIPQIELETAAQDMMSAIRSSQEALAHLPQHARARVQAFDPEGQAQVMGSHFSDARPVAGRRVFGGRPQAWQDLEDKVRAPELWSAAGVAQAPSCVVPAERDALAQAWREVGGGGDVVLAGDSREGFNGGGTYVHWVRTAEHLERAARFFGAHCDRVRVMPFLEGLPCSIHGLVLSDGVVALRPCEMLVLRDPEQALFRYAGTASFWDPPTALRDEMRHVARRVGRHLGDSVGYRGAFTVDGVATAHGFLPTELNPRFGAALLNMTRHWDELPLYLLHLALVEGLELRRPAEELEALVLEEVDARRGARTATSLERTIETSGAGSLVREGGTWRDAEAGETADASYILGPGPTGGFLRITLDPERTPTGPPAAPRIVEILTHLDREQSLGIGALDASRWDP